MIPQTLLLTSALIALVPDDYDGLRGAIVVVGDVDGDKKPDLVLAHRSRPAGMTDSPAPGLAPDPILWVLGGADGRVLHVLEGGKGFGKSLAPVGDLDGDGAIELAVGDSSGGVSLVSPKKGRVLVELDIPESLEGAARALAGGVQLTGDSTFDLVIGLSGGAVIVDGSSWLPVETLVPLAGCQMLRQLAEGWKLPTLSKTDTPGFASKTKARGKVYSFAGMNVAVLDDLDGDGLGEVSLSLPREHACEAAEEGPSYGAAQSDARTRVLFSAGKRKPLSLPTAAWCLASGEDLDKDGIPDIVTTTVNTHTRSWSGATGAMLWEVSYLGGYLNGEGTSLAFTSDHDKDGIADLVVGANETFLDADAGWATILSGATGKQLKRYDVRSKTSSGQTSGYHGGADVAPVGDLDGDGLEELAVWIPMQQSLRLLKGSDFTVFWEIDVAALRRPK